MIQISTNSESYHNCNIIAVLCLVITEVTCESTGVYSPVFPFNGSRSINYQFKEIIQVKDMYCEKLEFAYFHHHINCKAVDIHHWKKMHLFLVCSCYCSCQ